MVQVATIPVTCPGIIQSRKSPFFSTVTMTDLKTPLKKEPTNLKKMCLKLVAKSLGSIRERTHKC